MGFLFFAPANIVPILLGILILIIVVAIIFLAAGRKNRERRRKMQQSIEKMKKLEAAVSQLNLKNIEK